MMFRKSLVLSAVLIAAALHIPTASAAQPVAINNPGFESNPIADGTFAVFVPSSWQLYDPQGIVNQTTNAVGVIRPNIPQAFFPSGATEGSQAALVFLAGPVNAPVGIQQTLAATLQANTRYDLSVDIGNIDSGTSLPGSADGGNVFYNLKGFPGYRIEVLAGGTLLASDTSSTGTIPEGQWRTSTLSVATSASPAELGQPLTIRLINLDTPGTPAEPAIEVDFDNVRLMATPVPEPMTWVLCLAGVALLVLRGHGRSSARQTIR